MTFTYSINCTSSDCNKPAQYKIAARWSDGITEELKTYSLTCADCLKQAFLKSIEKQTACRLAQGEVLNRPGIYRLVKGHKDLQLERLPELEKEMLGS